jgi:hypothetical protein
MIIFTILLITPNDSVEGTTDSDWIGSLVGPKASLDMAAKESYICGEMNPGSPVINQPL